MRKLVTILVALTVFWTSAFAGNNSCPFHVGVRSVRSHLMTLLKTPKLLIDVIVPIIQGKGINEASERLHLRNGNYVVLMRPDGKKYHFVGNVNDVRAIAKLTSQEAANGESAIEKYSFSKIPALNHLVGDHSIFIEEGTSWHSHARALRKGFTPKAMEQGGANQVMFDVMNRKTKELNDSMNGNGQRQTTLNMKQFISEASFEILLKGLFGVDVQPQEISSLVKHFEIVMREVGDNLKDPRITLFGWKLNKIKNFESFAVIQEFVRRQILEMKTQKPEARTPLAEEVLALKSKDGVPVTEEQLFQQIMFLFTAGFETTTSATLSTLNLLVQNSKRLTDLVQEVRSAKSGLNEYVHGSEETALSRAIYSALKIRPPTPLFLRTVKAAMTFKLNSGKTVEFLPGDTIVLSARAAGMEMAQWERAHELTADHHVHEAGNQTIAFGAGPRVCMGRAFAFLEMKVITASLVQNFDLQVSQGPSSDKSDQYVTDFSHHLEQPLHLVLTRK